MKIGNRLFEYIDELPPEIKDEIKISAGDELERKINKVLNEHLDGVGRIDEILIGLFKFENCTKKEVTSRRFLMNKLYRMEKEEKLKKYTDTTGTVKKGIYEVTNRDTVVSNTDEQNIDGGGEKENDISDW